MKKTAPIGRIALGVFGPYLNAWECDQCGALITEPVVHEKFHLQYEVKKPIERRA